MDEVPEPAVGGLWVYRLRDCAPSEQVKVLAVHDGRSRRYDVKFTDGDTNGRTENVPGKRLRVPWSDVTAYDQLMANWKRIGGYELTEVEEAALEYAYQLLMPDTVASWSWKPIRNSTEVVDIDGLSAVIGKPAEDLIASVESFELEGAWWLSAEGTVKIVELACRTRPEPVLDWVFAEETRRRDECKHGTPSTRRDAGTSAEWEYQWYLEHDRHLYELLRQWCGHRGVTLHERLAAAEAEVHRLDLLVVECLDDLAQHNPNAAKILAEEHVRHRITPETVRPVVERPIPQSEMPVHVVYRNRWWAH